MAAGAPGGASVVALAIGLAIGILSILLWGAFFGVIGAAIAHASLCRPRRRPAAR